MKILNYQIVYKQILLYNKKNKNLYKINYQRIKFKMLV